VRRFLQRSWFLPQLCAREGSITIALWLGELRGQGAARRAIAVACGGSLAKLKFRTSPANAPSAIDAAAMRGNILR